MNVGALELAVGGAGQTRRRVAERLPARRRPVHVADVARDAAARGARTG